METLREMIDKKRVEAYNMANESRREIAECNDVVELRANVKHLEKRLNIAHSELNGVNAALGILIDAVSVLQKATGEPPGESDADRLRREIGLLRIHTEYMYDKFTSMLELWDVYVTEE